MMSLAPQQDTAATTQASSLSYSVIIPCYNEEDAIGDTLNQLLDHLADGPAYEVIVVDDGSTDGSAEKIEQIAKDQPQVRVVAHPQNRGYGAALKSGIRQSKAELIVITDADGTYPNERIPELVALAAKADMVVGARIGDNVQYSLLRRIPKVVLSGYAAWLSGRRIPDLNSGLRVMRRTVLEKFIGILPDTFSFTTTITLAMLINFYNVEYVPISYSKRVGQSKIRPIADTLRFFQLILRTGMYFAPLRVFLPVGVLLGIAFCASLTYDVFFLRDLTEKTLLLLLFSMNTVMFALLADMIDKRVAK